MKERILEFLAVKQLAPELKGQVLCLVGPPGVGKTSIAMSMARAMNRKLARISLGGVQRRGGDPGPPQDLCGRHARPHHQRHQPGGSSNPLLLLDEIDKLGNDHRGDPASALLEVLDGEQNAAFRDHFLEVPFDLSDVLFITTANTTDTIPRPAAGPDGGHRAAQLHRRGEASDRQAPPAAQAAEAPRAGPRRQLKVSDGAIREMIACYTRESGVRVLERKMAALCRKAAMKLVDGNMQVWFTLQSEDLEEYLGAPRNSTRSARHCDQRVGVVNGLAWTSVGGELLEVEVNVVPGSGKVELTGNLGDVMKESAQAALSYIRSRAARAGH